MRCAWQHLAPRLPPGLLPRSGGTALPLRDEGFLLVGGYVEDTATTPPTRAPTAEVLAVRLGGGATLVEPRGPAPPPRLAAAGATVGSTAWLLGGWDPGTKGDGGVILDDVWSSCDGGSTWTQHPGARLPGGPASRAAAAALPDGSGRIVLLTHRCGEEVIVLDASNPAAPAWSSLPASPDPAGAGFPPSRGLASLVALPPTAGGDSSSSTLLLFGGAPKRGGMDNDLWRLTLRGGAAAAWERLGPGAPGAAAPWPPVRCSHVAAAAPGGMVVWGGSFYDSASGTGGLVARDDAWWWDEGAGGWTALEAGGGDPPLAARNAAAAAGVVGADGRCGVLISGGWDPFRVTYGDTAVLWLEKA